jgi:hypothetical protein
MEGDTIRITALPPELLWMVFGTPPLRSKDLLLSLAPCSRHLRDQVVTYLRRVTVRIDRLANLDRLARIPSFVVHLRVDHIDSDRWTSRKMPPGLVSLDVGVQSRKGITKAIHRSRLKQIVLRI